MDVNMPKNHPYVCAPRQMQASMYTSNVGDSPFKANFLLLNKLVQNIREPPNCTGNELTLDIPVGNTCYL